jgi:hypothetical protein
VPCTTPAPAARCRSFPPTAALPENLIENEFFGHVRGAYTDAREPQPGLIAQAQGGTLLLDEVDALPLRGQVTLLRFFQDLLYRLKIFSPTLLVCSINLRFVPSRKLHTAEIPAGFGL